MSDLTINTAPGLPEFEKKKTWETVTPGTVTTTPGDETSTETPSESPERLAAERGMDDAANAELAVAERGKAAGIETARLGGVASQEQSDLAAHQAADRAAAQNIANDEINRAREYHAKKQAELDATPEASLWGGARHPVLNGIAMALGGIGDAIQRAAMVRIGKAPPTIDTVGDIINGELNRQREHIAKLKDSVVSARTGIADAKEAREQMLQDVDHNGAEMYKRLEALSKARLAAQGVDAAGIEGDKNIAAIRSKRAEHQSAYVAPLIGRVTKKVEGATIKTEGPTRKSGGDEINRSPTASGKGPTESQAKTADYSAGMLDEIKTIEANPTLTQDELAQVQNNQAASNTADSATGPVGTAAARAGRAMGAVPRTKYEGLSPSAQKSMNAWDSLVELRARQLTGAGMPEQEAIREARTLGYSPDDTPALMTQKLERLRAAAERGLKLSGPGAAAIAPGATPPPKTPPTARSRAIQVIMERPNTPGARLLKKKFNISDAELR